MAEPRWVSRLAVDAVHSDQLREHDGLAGVRDENVLGSALARARNKWGYENTSDFAVLAAAYGYRIGFDLSATEPEVVTPMLGVAEGQVSEAVRF